MGTSLQRLFDELLKNFLDRTCAIWPRLEGKKIAAIAEAFGAQIAPHLYNGPIGGARVGFHEEHGYILNPTYDSNWSGVNEVKSAPGRPPVGGVSGGGRGKQTSVMTQLKEGFEPLPGENTSDGSGENGSAVIVAAAGRP